MSARSTRLAAFAAVTVALVAACAGSASPAVPASGSPSTASSATPVPDSPSPSASPSPAALVLKVTSEGGFINPLANLAALPIVEVYSDGKILSPGPIEAIEPGPLLAPVQVRDVGPAGASAIVAAVRAAGLDKAAAGGPAIPGDSGTDIFSVSLDGQTTATRLAGGGPGPGGPGVGGSQDPGRAAAFDLLNRLLDPTETWGAASVSATAYAPLGYRVYAWPGAPQSDPAIAQKPVAWPLAPPLDQFGTPSVPDRGVAGLRQGAVLGADAATLGPILSRATTATGFTSGGQMWTLAVRPLLPDELAG